MLTGFPQSTTTNFRALVMILVQAVEEFSVEAVAVTCQEFLAGNVSGQSLDFAPSCPRFVQAVEARQDFLELTERQKRRAQITFIPTKDSIKPDVIYLRDSEEMQKHWAKMAAALAHGDMEAIEKLVDEAEQKKGKWK